MRPSPALCLIVLALTASPAFAWTLGGDRPPTRIPIPSRELSATALDVSGTAVQLTAISFDGEVVLFGTLGKAQVTLDLERVELIEFSAAQDAKHRRATATLVDGTTAQIIVEADLPFYGQATFGNYRIYAEDLNKVTLTR